jgi:hypothetical protein
MIDEIEARIAYTINKIRNKRKEIQKMREEIVYLEGSLNAYKELDIKARELCQNL